MFDTDHSNHPKQNLNQMVGKEARVRQLPASRTWIASSRTSAALTLFVLVFWIGMSVMNDFLFLKEVIASSFIIGCSVLFNRSNFTRNVLN